MSTKKDLTTKIKRAEELFKCNTSQTEIADIVGVSRVTLTNWVKKYSWREKRAAVNISRPELVNKLLMAIDNMLEQVSNSDDPSAVAGLGDKLSKFAAVIDKLDKKANVVDILDVCTAFSKWLQTRMQFDSELTVDIVKIINRYQDLFVAEQLNKRI